VAVATGLGKTWLAAFDVLAVGRALQRPRRRLTPPFVRGPAADFPVRRER
jgi:hypothetical protein